MPTVMWARHGFKRFLRSSSGGIFQTSPLGDAWPVSEHKLLPAYAPKKTTKTAVEQCSPTNGNIRRGPGGRTVPSAKMTQNELIRKMHMPTPAHAGMMYHSILPYPQGTASLTELIEYGAEVHGPRAGTNPQSDSEGWIIRNTQLTDRKPLAAAAIHQRLPPSKPPSDTTTVSVTRNGPSRTHTHTQEGAEEDRKDWLFQSTKAQITYPTPHTMIANCLRPLPDVPPSKPLSDTATVSVTRNGPPRTHTHTQEGAKEDRKDWFFQSTKAQITDPTPHTMIAN